MAWMAIDKGMMGRSVLPRVGGVKDTHLSLVLMMDPTNLSFLSLSLDGGTSRPLLVVVPLSFSFGCVCVAVSADISVMSFTTTYY